MASDSFVPVARASELPLGAARTVVLADGREVALVNAGGTIYAIDNRCPHQGASLVDGWVDDTTITCPWHAWCFNLADGRMAMGGFAALATFDVRIDGEDVFIASTPRPRPPRA